MNKTYSEKYKDFIFYEKSKLPYIEQTVYRFENGYGASFIWGEFSYGLEVVILKFDGDDWEITYDTHITDDVICYVTNIDDILESVKEILS